VNYTEFLDRKSQMDHAHGFEPIEMPDFLFDFQRALVDWSLRKGRSAIFADCGLGKTPMQLVWADNVARHTNGNVLFLTPLAVGQQLVDEGKKFGIEVGISRDGKPTGKMTAINYERLHKADESDYVGVVCDESSICKHWSGKTQMAVTRFLAKKQYRLLCTATPAPNDFVELGTSSEALGELSHSQMLETFFRQITDDEKRRKATADDIIHSKRLSWRVIQSIGQWALKAHAFEPFWKWVSVWARACRKPSDLGDFDDSRFVLPPLNRFDHTITPRTPPEGYLFTIPAFGLNQERSERRRTIAERAELVASLVDGTEPVVIWCQLNDEADHIEKLIPDAVQVKGSQSIERKEELLTAFLTGECRVLVTKAKIAGLGLNMQHCAHAITFVDHSYEKFYQSIRRCWRFGQTRPVRVDVISTEGEVNVKKNMDRKEQLATQMFESIVAFMNDSKTISGNLPQQKVETPAWLSTLK
jgi:superfamily II DNA or RNA helicase